MKLLIIEDELSLLKSMIDFFRKENFICEHAAGFEEGREKISLFAYDCIILDINLPGGSGLRLLEYIRQHNKGEGVVIISARSSVDDRIEGLDLGADDYLTKPFHLSELNARMKALIRRKYAGGGHTLSMEGLTIDLKAKEVYVKEQPVLLTRNEYELLFFLINNKNRVVSRQAIAEHLSGEASDNLDSFDFVYSHVKNLKKKLKDKGCADTIKTIYGFGYKFETT
jgi:DNA-binding response OmpR family regulator